MASRKCLLVVDVQNAMFKLDPPLFNGAAILENIKVLVKKARSQNGRVVYVQHCGHADSPFKKGTAGWKIHPSIAPAVKEHVVEKKHSDPFQESDLSDILMNSWVDHIVVCGFVTEGCIDSTVRRAYSLGFKIELASDCHSTTDGKVLTAEQTINHHNEILKIFSDVKESKDINFNE